MDLPDLVLVHGGAHAADCWDLTVAELACQEPKLRVLAVDLPGRGRNPADLTTVTIADWVDSVVAEVRNASLGDVVLVGHSMGGLTVPVTATELLLGGSIFPAMQNFLLAARAQGLGACLTSWASYGGERPLRTAVGVPEDWMVAGHIVVGWPKGNHGPLRRRPLAEFVNLDRWGEPADDVVDAIQAGPVTP
jgi:pimeloyl-ACP methyl ester carboxylesterase